MSCHASSLIAVPKLWNSRICWQLIMKASPKRLVNNDFRGSVAQVLVVNISVPATTGDMLAGTKDGVSSSKCR